MGFVNARVVPWLLAAVLAAFGGATGALGAPPSVVAGGREATVMSWHDGDSLRIRERLGTRAVRLIGIDAPEVTPGEHADRHVRRLNRNLAEIMELGRQARIVAERLAPPGTAVVLEPDVEYRDRNGRLLAYAWLPDGRMINEELVRQGWAVTLTIPPNVRHVERFVAAQRFARAARRGIWR